MSISITNHTGPILAEKKYELQCDVQNFAPLNILSVSWYKESTLIKNRGFNDLPIKTPSNKTVTLKISPTKDDAEAQYRCEAKLKLGLEEHSPIVKSNLLKVTVHCE